MAHRPRSAVPDILVPHHRKKSAEREGDDGADDRPTPMCDERFADVLHPCRRQNPEDTADNEQPAENSDEAPPIARPCVMHVENSKPGGKGGNA